MTKLISMAQLITWAVHWEMADTYNTYCSTFLFTGGDHTFNGGGTDGNATFSEGEGDTSKATDTDLSHISPKKEKKKKSGLRTPSFLKKKKKDKKKEKA